MLANGIYRYNVHPTLYRMLLLLYNFITEWHVTMNIPAFLLCGFP